MNEKLKIINPPVVEETDEKQKTVSYQRECKRCGRCCKAASPMLLKPDYNLFVSGLLNETNTYTLRVGEPMLNKHEKDLYIVPFELIKIDEENLVCYFYEDTGVCTIYESRPIQCKFFECWNSIPYQDTLEKTRLTRQDIFGDVEPVMKIIRKHEEACSYLTLNETIQKLKDGDESHLTQIQEMIDFDIATREFLNENYGISPRGLHLVLGKPLFRTINLWGLQVVENEDGLSLLPIKEAGDEDIS